MSTHTLRRNHLNSSTYLKNISSTSNFPPLLHLHSQCMPGPTFTCLDYGPLRQPKTGLPTSTPTLLPPCQERGAGSFSKCKQCLFLIKSLWVTPSWPLGKWHSLSQCGLCDLALHGLPVSQVVRSPSPLFVHCFLLLFLECLTACCASLMPEGLSPGPKALLCVFRGLVPLLFKFTYGRQ